MEKCISQSFILNKIETTEKLSGVSWLLLSSKGNIASFFQMVALLSLLHQGTGLLFLRRELLTRLTRSSQRYLSEWMNVFIYLNQEDSWDTLSVFQEWSIYNIHIQHNKNDWTWMTRINKVLQWSIFWYGVWYFSVWNEGSIFKSSPQCIFTKKHYLPCSEISDMSCCLRYK